MRDVPGDAVLQRFRLERRITRRSAAMRTLTWALALGAPAAVLAVLHARMTGVGIGGAVDRLVLAWSALILAALLGCAAAFLLRRPGDAALAREMDRRHDRTGLFSAAAFLLGRGEAGPELGTLVLARADDAVRETPVTSRVRHLGFKVRRTALCLLLSLLIALLPGGPRGKVAGLGSGNEGPAEASGGAGAEAGVETAPESRQDRQVPLEEVISLELRSDRKIYGLGGEVTLFLELESKKDVAADVPLEFMLAITDGLPSPDVGFGEGFRPVPLRLEWSVPREKGTKLKQGFPMKETLQALGIYRPGLFTAEVYALPKDSGGAVSDGARSNEITFQVAENKEDAQTRMPQPQGQGKQPEKPTGDQKTEDEGSPKGKSKPKLGDPDRLAEAQRVASLVKPIVNPGPTVDKEVSVFEREPGGPAPPMPVRRKPRDDTPARTFLRRPEAPIDPPDLTPEERDVLRRYFDAIRGQKKL